MMTLKKKVLCGLMAAALMSPTASYAAEVVEEAPAQHQTASMVQSEEQGKTVSKKDVKKLQQRIAELEQQLSDTQSENQDLYQEVARIQESQDAIERGDSLTHGYPATSNYLVEPGWNGNVGYTQDAVNAQGDSTMVFSYSPSQLYKIYCKLNYLTDIQLHEGEQITFVGGGDTGKWMLDTATIDGTPHLYLKPIARNAKTNLIINTTHHSYQVLCNEGDWYNPMIKWSYGAENIQKSTAMQKMNALTSTGAVSDIESLNFDYSIRGDVSWKPKRVFDDGKKTWIQFDHAIKKLPILFVKEKGKKGAEMVNYKVRDDCFVVDRTFPEAELKLDNETVKIRTRH